ncbi:TPA: translation initiation factor IF-5A [Candidatus Micrarchaeota archaeon]|nr:translation initiation factor IF-5A [Candidatus Micrarchaeota archaeon]
MAGEVVFGQMGDLKVGKYVIIEGEACRIVSMDKSKPGKHGAAKINVVAISLSTNNKRTLMKSSDADVEIPIVERKRAQVVSVSGNTAQLMDTESFEVFETDLPEDLRSEAQPGREIQYMLVMGMKLLQKVSVEA